MTPIRARQVPVQVGELDWDEARRRAHAAAARLAAVEVPLAGALGRTLAGPLIAPLPLPGFDTAAMDGYAVRGAAPWLVTGRTLAGQPAAPELAAGRAQEIATGAPVPAGAEAVLPYEAASRDGDLVTGQITGQNIRRAGEEAQPGQAMLPAGTRVSPQVQALAAALGYDELPVGQRPRLEAIITGDEVLRQGLPDPGRVRDAIGPALGGLASGAGGQLTRTRYLPDRGAELGRALDETVGEIVLVAGSSSVGQADYLHECLRGRHAEPIVGSVACRPGRTQSLWRLPDRRIVVGLPGNPFAAFAAFLTLAAPCCAGFTGAGLAELAPAGLGSVKADPSRTRLVPVRLRSGRVEPLPLDGSAMLAGLAAAEALAVVPPASSSDRQIRLLPLP